MGKSAPWVLLLAISALLLAVSIHYSHYLSDEGNPFLKDFMDNDILSVLGFITAVGNAATLSIFLHLNRLEDETPVKFSRTRSSLKKSAVSLVYIFMIAFLALITKPLLGSAEVSSAIMNSIGIICIIFSLSVLRDLTLTVFGIPTKKRIAEIEAENKTTKQQA